MCLQGLVEAMDVSATQVIQEWHHTLSETAQGCAHIDAAEAFSRYAADVIARTAFGSSYQLGHKIFNLSTELSHLIIDNAYYSALPLYKYGHCPQRHFVLASIEVFRPRPRAATQLQVMTSDASASSLMQMFPFGKFSASGTFPPRETNAWHRSSKPWKTTSG